MPTEKLDPISAALALTALTTVAIAVFTKPTPGKSAAVMVSTLAFIGYDRWHDGMWPFTNIERQRQADMLD